MFKEKITVKDVIISLFLIFSSLILSIVIKKLDIDFLMYFPLGFFCALTAYILSPVFIIVDNLLLFILNRFILFNGNILSMNSIMALSEIIVLSIVIYISYKKYRCSSVTSILLAIILSKLVSLTVFLLLAGYFNIVNIEEFIKVYFINSLQAMIADIVIIPFMLYTLESFTLINER